MLISLKNYNISFQRNKHEQQLQVSVLKPVHNYKTIRSYQNILSEPLKSVPNSDFAEKLKKVPDIYSLQKAQTRIANLSRYLKEDMIGFVLPEYEVKGEKRGGYQWFEKGAEYLLKGCQHGTKEKDFQSIAKDLYGLLSLHDNYWKSREFSDYLSTLKQTPAIKATKQAIQELQKSETVSFGYSSILKHIDKLLNNGCAYSGHPLVYCSGASLDRLASVDHILPKCWGGPCDDYNYILCSSETNAARGNISFLDFLKGHDVAD
ncbi:MAG: hypothetical protein WC197_06260 [Candidatus Gastranaerophilaceae bacterium]|jgi:hypothetical protein